ncbi:MAG: transposase, partial [Candidatus Lokiarchaeota archaeon]|nr:transposase [Candidatus Lokiarchaeota archaeon]
EKHLILVDRYFPSSKLCSCCGYKNIGLELNDREWTCPKC